MDSPEIGGRRPDAGLNGGGSLRVVGELVEDGLNDRQGAEAVGSSLDIVVL